MSFVASLIVFLIKQIWPFVIIGLLVGFWATMRFQPSIQQPPAEQKRLKRLRAFFQSWVVVLPSVVYLLGSYISNPLIYYTGIEASAKVISQEQTRTLRNYERVLQMNVVFVRADGELQRSSFRTDEFNLYPKDGPAVYPRSGEEFKVRYLPKIPRYFVILNTLPIR
ncbi:hypothetical protein [Oligella urethralis]|uniref:hypothetical protein n=1 Tax=Oligella urethralis TaxID=90245 RepID=UPI0027B9BDFE|nr:hypothetical protein [Oligella urethralis]